MPFNDSMLSFGLFFGALGQCFDVVLVDFTVQVDFVEGVVQIVV